jgi:hypothetical protein
MDHKTEQNTHKFVYLIEQYPEHKLGQIIELLAGMSPLDINAAIWNAQEAGYISEPDADTQTVKLLRTPKKWDFGEDVQHLEHTFLYGFEHVASQENDLEEHAVTAWSQGYLPHDALIALKRLQENGQINQYTIDDTEESGAVNTYTFFTLEENMGKLWGRKQFKNDPLAGKEDGPRDPRVLQEDQDEQADLQEKAQREDQE